nr:hypothetical protein [Rhodoferax sp.]
MSDHEAMKKKLRRPLPMRGFERRLYAAVLLALLFGVTWSLTARDWQFFERSGSLVVVVGVALTWRDFVQTLGNVESFYRAEYARLLRDFDAQRPTGIIAGAMHDGKREDIEAKQAYAVEMVGMLKDRLRTTEAVIVCLGTLVWGYGSPLGNALWSFQ